MPKSLTCALLGSKTLGGELGKKGTSTDITLYNHSTEALNVSYVEPTQFPEKYPSLLNAIHMGGGRVVLAVEAITKDLGEIVVTLDMMGAKDGLIAVPETLGKEDLQRMLKGTILEHYEFVSLDPKAIRQKVEAWPEKTGDEGSLLLPLDHAFPVRGVGTVALGLVERGRVKAHDRLRLFPTDTMVEVRSLQVHDVDMTEAGIGQRVGLALKGVEADEIRRGQVLAPPDGLKTGDLLQLRGYTPCKFFKGKAGEGDKVHVSLGLDDAPAKITTVDGSNLTLTLSRPMAWTPGDRALVVDLSGSGNRPRVAGFGTSD
ncbi:MAG: EF-Tu/IF-2/RF-3 family GTPase [Candidatus Thermoplasmatota archaeon]|jgi:selenocysteine-specific translation elongation factor|nr:EF-Tu/IF-2/RF-3 family GTPase [Candidatus Thermoplasmatota archaeon]MCL5984323.1 EF-Tu/IF-2/RF-3 family GTPase [Candidatus Thermoplasmatota archaeon]